MSELHHRYLDLLLKTQHLPSDRLDAYQDRLRADVIAHAAMHVPFYRDTGRLAPVLGPHGRDRDRWHEVPVLTRPQAIAAGASLQAQWVPPQSGGHHASGTSGSTGTPFRFIRSEATSLAAACCGERHRIWHGLDGDRDIGEISVDADRADRGVTEHELREVFGHKGRLLHLEANAPKCDPLDWIAETGVAYLITHPSFARVLARDALSGRGRKIRVEALTSVGEVLTPEARAEILEGLADRVIDRYAAEEFGPLALECEHGRLHVQSEANLVEILDDAGQPAPPGEDGHVVVTAFYNFAMPLIRYDTGDIGALSPEPCPCGRTLPVLMRVRGRVREVFRLPDGRKIWPFLPFRSIAEVLPLSQFQVVQTAPGAVEIRYVPADGMAPDFEAATALVRSHLTPDMAVNFVAMAEIPRTASGKYFDYISRVSDDDIARPE